MQIAPSSEAAGLGFKAVPTATLLAALSALTLSLLRWKRMIRELKETKKLPKMSAIDDDSSVANERRDVDVDD